MTSRIHRGFHRIGVVLAAPVALIAVGLACHEVWWKWQDKKQLASGVDRDLAALLAEPFPFPHVVDLTSAGLVLALALALYAAARAVGWMLIGFTKPNRT